MRLAKLTASYVSPSQLEGKQEMETPALWPAFV
jgi:hypothetical protein